MMRTSVYTVLKHAATCLALLCACTFESKAQCQEPTEVIVPAAGQRFIGSLSFFGDSLVVKGYDEDLEAPLLLLFSHDGSGWQALPATEVETSGPIDTFSHVVVGRVEGDSSWPYVYRRLGDTLTRFSHLRPPFTVGSRFGEAVAIRGNELVLGTPPTTPEQRGIVYSYRQDGPTYRYLAPMVAPEIEDRIFGSKVALGGLVGNICAVVGQSNGKPTVYVHRLSGSWIRAAAIPVTGDVDLPHLDFADDQLLIFTGNPDAPVEAYGFDGSSWDLQQVLPGPERWFGWARHPAGSAHLAGNTAVFGGDFVDGETGQRGVAYLYTSDGEEWSMERRLLHSGAETGFGQAVDANDSWVAVGAENAIYMYDRSLPSVPCPEPPSDETSGLRISVDGMLSPQTPTVALTVRAFFHADDFAFGAATFDASAEEPGWTVCELLGPAGSSPGTAAGLISGSKVSGVTARQLNDPDGGMYADPANPIDIWRAEFKTDSYEPRLVGAHLVTRSFAAYPQRESSALEPRILGIADPVAYVRVWRSSCLADCDGSGDLDFFDFLCFQDLIAAGNLAADLDGDGELTFFDFLVFQDAFARGCP